MVFQMNNTHILWAMGIWFGVLVDFLIKLDQRAFNLLSIYTFVSDLVREHNCFIYENIQIRHD